ncbi:MAG: hypothetical protein HY606_15210 [Planctomycetes bacterium]|nr:hypothetical protein [Planctomycetota bacterium]
MDKDNIIQYLDWIDKLYTETTEILQVEIADGKSMDIELILQNLEKKDNLMTEIETTFNTVEKEIKNNRIPKEGILADSISARMEVMRQKISKIQEMSAKTIEIFKERKSEIEEKLKTLRNKKQLTAKYSFLKDDSENKSSYFDTKNRDKNKQ